MSNQDRRRLVCAAILGVSNCGMPRPEEPTITALLNNYPDHVVFTVNDMVEHLAQQYIENDDHFAMFAEEIEAWYDQNNTEEYVKTMWPWVGNLLDAADEKKKATSTA